MHCLPYHRPIFRRDQPILLLRLGTLTARRARLATMPTTTA